MNKLYSFISIFLFLISVIAKDSFAFDPTFKLDLTNTTYTSSNAGYFDIVITHTNYPTTDFYYTAGLFVINLDPALAAGYSFFKDTATYGAPYYENRLPKTGNVSLSGNQLRVSGNPPIIPSFLISHTNGTLVIRIKFKNNNLYSYTCIAAFSPMVWVTEGAGVFTKIFADIGGTGVVLNNSSNSFQNHICNSLSYCCIGIPSPPPVRIAPVNNQTNLYLPVVFSWNSNATEAYGYRIQISDDSLFSNIVDDEVFETSVSPFYYSSNNLSPNKTYYWHVKQRGFLNPYGEYNEIWKFTTIPTLSLYLQIIPEGYYDTVSSHPTFGVKVYLRDNYSPFALRDSTEDSIQYNAWSNLFQFNNAPTGRYYIVVKQFNTIETWSRAGGDSLMKGYFNNYNFSTAVTQAYGNNLIQVGSVYCIFSGDVNQDGNVDVTDIITVYNNAASFVPGFINTDLTGDYITDLTDLVIVANNSGDFVGTKRP